MIIDKFTNLKVSRQRKYQLRHFKKGLCAKCGKIIISSGLCKYHRMKEIETYHRRYKRLALKL